MKPDVAKILKGLIGGEKTLMEMLAEDQLPEDIKKDSMLRKVFFFLKDNPMPNDDQFHQWTEENGLDTHEAEKAAYMLATRFVQLMSGGRSMESGMAYEDADPEQLKMGIEVEFEHCKIPCIARKIALDHISEISDYYTRLEAMEKAAGIEE